MDPPKIVKGTVSTTLVLLSTYTEIVFINQGNPAADPRKIRRIIAEDPEWYLSLSILLI